MFSSFVKESLTNLINYNVLKLLKDYTLLKNLIVIPYGYITCYFNYLLIVQSAVHLTLQYKFKQCIILFNEKHFFNGKTLMLLTVLNKTSLHKCITLTHIFTISPLNLIQI